MSVDLFISNCHHFLGEIKNFQASYRNVSSMALSAQFAIPALGIAGIAHHMTSDKSNHDRIQTVLRIHSLLNIILMHSQKWSSSDRFATVPLRVINVLIAAREKDLVFFGGNLIATIAQIASNRLEVILAIDVAMEAFNVYRKRKKEDPLDKIKKYVLEPITKYNPEKLEDAYALLSIDAAHQKDLPYIKERYEKIIDNLSGILSRMTRRVLNTPGDTPGGLSFEVVETSMEYRHRAYKTITKEFE